jgi:hypothetical protein
MELKASTSIVVLPLFIIPMNPYNGIESSEGVNPPVALLNRLGIHTMELKGVSTSSIHPTLGCIGIHTMELKGYASIH